MIDYINIQKQLLSAIGKQSACAGVCVDENDVFVTIDQTIAYRIPRRKFFIDTRIMEEFNALKSLFERVFAKELEDTGMLEVQGRRTLRIFRFPNGTTCKFDEKILKTVKARKDEKYAYRSNGKKSAMQIFSNEVCVAIIMPVADRK